MKEKDIVKFWLEDIVIGLNLCPFAKVPYENGLVDIRLCLFLEEEKRTHFFLDSLEQVILHPDAQYNALVVFPRLVDHFEDFNDWVGFLEDLLADQDIDQHVQLVGFHPDFRFEGEEDERANLVNSSPYPIIHILKKAAIQQVMKDPREAEKISRINTDKLKALTSDEIKAKFFWKK